MIRILAIALMAAVFFTLGAGLALYVSGVTELSQSGRMDGE